MDWSRQLQDKTRIIYVLGFGVAYIGDFMEGIGWIVHYYCNVNFKGNNLICPYSLRFPHLHWANAIEASFNSSPFSVKYNHQWTLSNGLSRVWHQTITCGPFY